MSFDKLERLRSLFFILGVDNVRLRCYNIDITNREEIICIKFFINIVVFGVQTLCTKKNWLCLNSQSLITLELERFRKFDKQPKPPRGGLQGLAALH